MGPTTDHAILEQPPNTHKNNGLKNGIKSDVQKIIDSHSDVYRAASEHSTTTLV